jgi:FkbM family methyltransferase
MDQHDAGDRIGRGAREALMPQAPSSRFRRESRLEAMARQWPASGVFGRVRRALKPIFETAIGWRGAIEARFPGGEIVRLDPAWRHLSWNADEYAAFRQVIRPGDCVLDVGANAGGYTILFAQWVGPAGRVYAFEPDPRAFAALVRHVALNGVLDRVVAVNAAVSDGSGSARLRLAAATGLSHVTDAEDERAEDITVDAVSIDGFCARASLCPSFIKIDIEGAELRALRGARRTLAASQPRVFVEMHPQAWRQVGCSGEAILRECSSAGYELERLDGSRSGLWDVEGACLRLHPVGTVR